MLLKDIFNLALKACPPEKLDELKANEEGARKMYILHADLTEIACTFWDLDHIEGVLRNLGADSTLAKEDKMALLRDALLDIDWGSANTQIFDLVNDALEREKEQEAAAA